MMPRHICEDKRCVICTPDTSKAWGQSYSSVVKDIEACESQLKALQEENEKLREVQYLVDVSLYREAIYALTTGDDYSKSLCVEHLNQAIERHKKDMLVTELEDALWGDISFLQCEKCRSLYSGKYCGNCVATYDQT